MGELRAPVNQRRALWNRHEDAAADRRPNTDSAAPETTDPPRQGAGHCENAVSVERASGWLGLRRLAEGGARKGRW
jgi:hypothetical protein